MHTPGPWNFTDAGELLRVQRTGLDEPPICELFPRDADSYTDEDLANGRLMSAAPELLAALKRNLPAIRMHANADDCDAAEAAIAKAEGRS